MVVGRSEIISRLARHPLARALRVDGATSPPSPPRPRCMPTAAARSSRSGRWPPPARPSWRSGPNALSPRSGAQPDHRAGHLRSRRRLGAGGECSQPGDHRRGKADRIFDALLMGEPPVLARREAGRVIVDLRAIPPADDDHLIKALSAACRS